MDELSLIVMALTGSHMLAWFLGGIQGSNRGIEIYQKMVGHDTPPKEQPKCGY